MSTSVPNYRPQIDEATVKVFMRELETLMRKHGMNPLTDEEQERQGTGESREAIQSRRIRCDQYQVVLHRVVDPVLTQKCHFGKATPTTVLESGRALIAEAIKQKPVLLVEFVLWSASFARNVIGAHGRPQEDRP